MGRGSLTATALIRIQETGLMISDAHACMHGHTIADLAMLRVLLPRAARSHSLAEGQGMEVEYSFPIQ